MLLLAGLAFAQDPPPTWEEDYDRGMRVARVGAITGGVGAAATGTGAVLVLVGAIGSLSPNGPSTSEQVLIYTGVISLIGGAGAAAAGSPLMAAGSLRAQRALGEGGVEVSPIPGRVAWGLWGGSMALWVVSAASSGEPYAGSLNAVGSLAFLGSYAAGGVQMGMDRHGYGAAPVSFLVAPMRVEGGAGTQLAFVW